MFAVHFHIVIVQSLGDENPTPYTCKHIQISKSLQRGTQKAEYLPRNEWEYILDNEKLLRTDFKILLVKQCVMLSY